MEKHEIFNLVHSVSVAKFFNVDKNSTHYKQLLEVVNTISNSFDKKTVMKTPSDFCIIPWGSVLKNTESERIAENIMIILKRTGNVFRLLTWDEYKAERLKDGNFTENEKPYFIRVMDYCLFPETAKLFSPKWMEIYSS